LLGRGHGLDL